MNIDIGFWLLLFLIICLIVWVVDRILKIRKSDKHPWKKQVEFAISLIPVFFVVLVVRSFVVEPFNIPSGSMIPTLKVGDFIAVEKFAYGLHLPVTNTEVISTGEPKRGDIMVFRFPKDHETHFIKRVIGVPGDTVSMKQGRLYLNGKKVPHTPLRHWVENGIYHLIAVENLDGHKHLIQRRFPINPYTGKPMRHYRELDGTWVVPPHHYFMMGDNRDNSNDSRYWGFVPESLVEGRAFLIWMHMEDDFPWIGFSRVGKLDKKENMK